LIFKNSDGIELVQSGSGQQDNCQARQSPNVLCKFTFYLLAYLHYKTLLG